MHIVLAALLALTLNGHADEPTRLERQCRFQKLDKATWTQREEWRTAQCVTERWTIPGGMGKLSSVISCESNWNRLAYNPSGYVGLAQHALSAWPSRVATYEPEWWTLDPRWMNSRTMLTVTVKMIQAGGWGPWTCA